METKPYQVMNGIEKLLMNNVLRAWTIEYYAWPKLMRLANGLLPGAGRSILEIGCGIGYGLGLILKKLHPAILHAMDSDPQMVAASKCRFSKITQKYPDMQARIFVGDAAAIDSENGYYDLVIGFGILHHIPQWQISVREIFRILEPGGILLLEESFAKFILHPVWRRILDHPHANRFDAAELIQCLSDNGFSNIRHRESGNQYMGWLVAQKPS